MAKRKSIADKLKSSNRRRRRRSAQTRLGIADTAVLGADHGSLQISITDSVISELLRYARDAGDEARDATVLAAINSILNSTHASLEEARRLSQQLQQIPERQNIPIKDFRKALRDILATANHHNDSLRIDAFLGYLELLSDD